MQRSQERENEIQNKTNFAFTTHDSDTYQTMTEVWKQSTPKNQWVENNRGKCAPTKAVLPPWGLGYPNKYSAKETWKKKLESIIRA